MKSGFSDKEISKVLQYNDHLIGINKEVFEVVNNDFCIRNGQQHEILTGLNKAVIIYRKGNLFATKKDGMWYL